MEKLIIFYDDTKASCCRCISRFEQRENVECRKMSDYKDKSLIFASGARLGLVFESENGKVPFAVSHIIWRVVADKNSEHMILVTGGRREFSAVRTAREDMEKRGYHVRNIYSRYLLEKHRIKEEDAVAWIMDDMETGQVRDRIEDKDKNMSRKELRKELRGEFRAYRKYQRDRLKG